MLRAATMTKSCPIGYRLGNLPTKSSPKHNVPGLELNHMIICFLLPTMEHFTNKNSPLFCSITQTIMSSQHHETQERRTSNAFTAILSSGRTD